MTAKLQLALDRQDKSGNLLSIYDVPVGRNCACYCPECLEPLEAKNNNKSPNKLLLKGQKTAHFAHHDGSICVSAPETAIHLLAKKVLQETKTLFLPRLFKENIELRPGKKITFHDVESEKERKRNGIAIIPDIILKFGERELFVEFFKTHKVDYSKAEKIEKINISCIEINLNGIEPLSKGKPNIEELKFHFENNSFRKKWIYNSKVENLHKLKLKQDEEQQKLLIEQEQAKQREREITLNRIADKTDRYKASLTEKGFTLIKVYDYYDKYDYDWFRFVYCKKTKENGRDNRLSLSDCEDCEFHKTVIIGVDYERTVACGLKNKLSKITPK